MRTMQKQVIYIPVASISKNPPVAAYARVSSDSDDQANSFESQVRHYTRIITENPNWEFAGMYADEGISGLGGERADFLRLLDDCRNGLIDTIIVKSVSRFYRNGLANILITRELKALGVNVVFEKENIDTDSIMFDEVRYTIQSYFAQKESNSISKNTSRGIRMRMKNGTYKATNAPLGYRLEDGKLILVPEQAKLVRRIYDLYLSGKGLQAIANILNREGVLTSHAKCKWAHTTLSRLIINPAYIGDTLLQKTYCVGETEIKKKYNKGEMPQYYIENTHEPIIDKETFQRANDLLEQRAAQHRSHNETPGRFLNKRLHCAHCGTVFRSKETKGGVSWNCRQHVNNIDACPMMPFPEREIHLAFLRGYNKLRTIRDYIFTPAAAQLKQLQDMKNRRSGEMAGLEERLLDLHKMNEAVIDLFDHHVISSEKYREKIAPIQNEMSAIHTRKRNLYLTLRRDSMLTEVELFLKALAEGPNWLEQFDEDLFDYLVKDVKIELDGAAHFHLLGDVTITEPIRRGL